MSADPVRRNDPNEVPPAVKAALQIWCEIERARGEKDAADALVNRLAGTLDLLLGALPEAERVEYRRRLDELQRATSEPDARGGEVYGSVIDLFRKTKRREWSIPDVQDALQKEGCSVEDPKVVKAIYNTLNYFAKTGRLERISRGRYRVLGADLTVPEDIADYGTQRLTEHDF